MADKIIKDMFGKLNKTDEKYLINFLTKENMTYEDYLQGKSNKEAMVECEGLNNQSMIDLGKNVPEYQKLLEINSHNNIGKKNLNADLQCYEVQEKPSQCDAVASSSLQSELLNETNICPNLTGACDNINPRQLIEAKLKRTLRRNSSRCPICLKKVRKKIYLKTASKIYLGFGSKCLDKKLEKEGTHVGVCKEYAAYIQDKNVVTVEDCDPCTSAKCSGKKLEKKDTHVDICKEYAENNQGKNDVTLKNCDPCTSVKSNITNGNPQVALKRQNKGGKGIYGKNDRCYRCGKILGKSNFKNLRSKISKRGVDSFIRNAARAGGYKYRFGEGSLDCITENFPNAKDCKKLKDQCKVINKVQRSKRKVIFRAIKPKLRKRRF
ncbi:uncharacterized protein LOC119684142 [Teleopsis dalmanni]|uniref:uncharacterized protein LOC119684142 n=1 Tax=Teleopsis dalmanni TaxID=139649 RepID=UPI0018CFD4A1|nr:uncharacterized protein LOC119684142 [Teleopsis dalmanni]XP_037954034.1 uncharacterized protein LOC119684142 [Teleopsis dalmanni]XP_037954035.1 uncharacterized protein LOC119684142 [Teleopsis dalmanni]XP_037954036.1 uncharacterized protein LOC119684142 [Teleopsis dalmanni]